MNRRPRIKLYREPGGGWGAPIATGKVLLEQKVLFKGALALYHMNKPGGGFKCSSCPWPDPSPRDADRLVICENGAKAVAWEMTARRATPEFFAQHSVTELSTQPDYWLERHQLKPVQDALDSDVPAQEQQVLDDKLDFISKSGADYLVSSDMLCLMHLQGCARRLGANVKVLHLAQVLNGVPQ